MQIGLGMTQIPYLVLGLILVAIALWTGFQLTHKSGHRGEIESLERAMFEAQRQLRAIRQGPKSMGMERLSHLLHVIQMRMRALPPDVFKRYEKRGKKLLQEAARLGITVSPEVKVQYK